MHRIRWSAIGSFKVFAALLLSISVANARCVRQLFDENSASLSRVENTCSYPVAINYCYDEPRGVYGLNCLHGHGSDTVLQPGEITWIEADSRYPDAQLHLRECRYPEDFNAISHKCQ